MKPAFLLAVLLGVEACTSATKVDPRIAHIRQEHHQLLAKQRAAAVTGEKGDFGPAGFRRLVQQSEAIQLALDQLDPSRSQDPAQVALVTELPHQQAGLLESASMILLMTGPSQSSFNEGTILEGKAGNTREATASDRLTDPSASTELSQPDGSAPDVPR